MPEDHAPPASSEQDAALRANNPLSIGAFAHPARWAIINALAMGEELTAPQCAKLTGLSLSATAYHLNLRERFQLRGRRRHRMRWLDPRASIRGPRADD